MMITHNTTQNHKQHSQSKRIWTEYEKEEEYINIFIIVCHHYNYNYYN